MLDSAGPNHHNLAYTTRSIGHEPLGARDDRQPPPEALEQRHEPAWPHGRPHRRARSASFLTRSSTQKTSPAAERCTHGLAAMSGAFGILTRAAIADLIDWHCWHRPPTDDVFRGACHACFFRPALRIPSLQALHKHEARAWLPKVSAMSAPPSFSPSFSQ